MNEVRERFLTRIGIFYDGNYFYHVSNYYCYGHPRKSRLSIPGIHDFIKRYVSLQENTSPAFCQIVDCHYFRGRLPAMEANERQILLNERIFDDILMREGIVTHYLPITRGGEKGVDVSLALEALELTLFKKFTNKKVDDGPFQRIPYRTAMEKYGSDKPDLRNPLVLSDVTSVVGSLSPLFEGKTVKAIVCKGFDKPRKYIDSLAEFVKEKEETCAFYWCKLDAQGAISGGVSKFIAPALDEFKKAIDADKDCFIALVAGEDKLHTTKCAGILRNELGTAMDICEKDCFKFCWICDFPMYEIDEETGELGFCHNPFSMPQGGLDALNNKDPLDILAYQYDIVCNGIELSSGAVRNHDPEIMVKAFAIAGYDESVIEKKFSALYNAFKFGAPPHAGIAPGVDRIVMLLGEEPSIREIIAFPMNRNAQDLLMGAPCEVTEKQLREANICVRK